MREFIAEVEVEIDEPKTSVASYINVNDSSKKIFHPLYFPGLLTYGSILTPKLKKWFSDI